MGQLRENENAVAKSGAARSLDPETIKDMKVAVLAGGKSGEREVSITSGEGASNALKEAGFNVTVLDPAEKDDLVTLINGDFDVAFLVLHGKYGEDGTMQGMLELLDIPYTGSGVWSSALAMDKVKSKTYYEKAGLDTPGSVVIEQGTEGDTQNILEKFGKVCVKPSQDGSARGVYIVDTVEDFDAAIASIHDSGQDVLVEQYIPGTELTVAVLGNDDAFALPVIHIVPKNEFYDYEAKYAPGGSQHICPAPLPDEITAKVQDQAVRAHKALECSGVSRSDFILDNNGKTWILETNTLPGMTATSLLPDAAKAGGISFPELCQKLVEYALERQEKDR